jgi:hypothetical protein
MPWIETFGVFVVCHVVGDYLLQTEWQALNKYGGLGGAGDPRALVSHVAMYGLAFVPALVWLGSEIGAGAAVGIAALVTVPHLLQDDGRLLSLYIREVKRSTVRPDEFVFIAVDQSFHLLALFGTALLAAA